MVVAVVVVCKPAAVAVAAVVVVLGVVEVVVEVVAVAPMVAVVVIAVQLWCSGDMPGQASGGGLPGPQYSKMERGHPDNVSATHASLKDMLQVSFVGLA